MTLEVAILSVIPGQEDAFLKVNEITFKKKFTVKFNATILCKMYFTE